MIENLEKVWSLMDSLGVTPTQVKIYYELDGFSDFDSLTNDDKELIISRVFDEYMGSFASLDEIMCVTYDHIQDILNDENFDFTLYL